MISASEARVETSSADVRVAAFMHALTSFERSADPAEFVEQSLLRAQLSRAQARTA